MAKNPGLQAAFDKGEDVLARLPVLGPLLGAESSEQKALIAQQKRMAEDAKRREELLRPARLAGFQQSMGAFAPRNKMMANVFGPDAAFSGKQMADMTADPMGGPTADPKVMALEQQLKKYGIDNYAELQAFNKDTDSRLTDNKGFTAAMAFRKQRDEAALKEKQRRAQMEQLFATGPGPAPINPIQAAPVRRF
jgi:hypothetical protein